MSESQNYENNILKSSQPHLAYVLLWYPLFTQPFIFREVECLRKIMPLKVYTLYGLNLRECSKEMKAAAGKAATMGVKKFFPIIANLCRQTGSNPIITFKLFKRSLWRKWPDMETFGENLWAFCTGILLGRQFKEDGIDFVYAPWPRGAATAAWVGATLAGLPFAIAARGDNLEPADPDLKDKFSASCFIRANNLADKKRIENFSQGAQKIELLYNSLTLPSPPPFSRSRKEKLHILALGRFDVTKGFDVLLKACAILRDQRLDFKLTLAGSGGKVMGLGNLERELRSLRKELKLEEFVNMPGLISHDELPEILKNHDIFAAPCVIHSSGRRDGIPNTIIEAMAYGLPVVSTNINALPEVVKDGQTGFTVPPNDPQALANAIKRLAQDATLGQQMGANGAKLARELFDPTANAKKLADIFTRHARGKICVE